MTLTLVVLINVALPAQLVHAATTRTIDVDDVEDNQPDAGCTLREAIDLANLGAEAGEYANGCTIAESAGSSPTPIVYEINLPSYTYTLSGAAREDGNASGDLDISANVTIQGIQTIISGGEIDRVFHIDPNGIGDVTVSIFSLVIQDGYAAFGSGGGGIYNNNGTVYIADSTLSGNQANVLGGGIYNQDGTVNIIDSTLSGNQAGVLGGGIYNRGSLDIAGSTILNNTSTESGGIRVYADSSGSATTKLSNCVVISNTAGDSGGGGIEVWASPDSTVTMTLDHSVISHNHSDGDGGGIYVWADESTATVALDDSTISDNGAAGDGGGVLVWASESAATVTLNHSTLNGNAAGGGGGGIHVSGGVVMLNNSTLSGNGAAGGGGGIYVSDGVVNLNNDTITENTADDDGSGDEGGGGIDIVSGTVHVRNTIVVGNHDKSGTGAEDCSISGTFNSQGSNLVGDTTGCPGDGIGDRLTVDPRLGSLADNGGDTQTHVLLFGSPAIDAVVDCTDLSGAPVMVDQRGVSRPVDGDSDDAAVCDIGAYEAIPLSISKMVTPTTDVAHHGIVTYTVLLSNSDLVNATDVLLTDTLPTQVDFVRWIRQPDGATASDGEITWNGQVAVNQVVTFTFVVTHTGDYGDIVTNTVEYGHVIGRNSDDAVFTVESMSFIYLPVVLRNV